MTADELGHRPASVLGIQCDVVVQKEQYCGYSVQSWQYARLGHMADEHGVFVHDEYGCAVLLIQRIV